MKHVTSIGYRRPRESGGPGQPFESCGPWVPAFAGMTDKRLILQESLRFRLSEAEAKTDGNRCTEGEIGGQASDLSRSAPCAPSMPCCSLRGRIQQERRQRFP